MKKHKYYAWIVHRNPPPMLFGAAGVKGLWVCEPYALFNLHEITVYEHSSNFRSLHISSIM